MIFRISAGPREILAATPIFREWKRRDLGDVLVETYHPEILTGNKYVDFAGREVTNCSESVVDFDMVEWWERPRPVTETFAIYALRDIRLGSWRTEMCPDDRVSIASQKIWAMGGKVALLGKNVSQDICKILFSLEYNILDISGAPFRDIAALAKVADLYVGNHGDESAVALTSDIPAVVLHSWLSPEFFKPFRRGVPHEAVRLRYNVCKDPLLCSERGIRAELGKVYGPRCTSDRGIKCLNAHATEDVERAIRRVASV